MNFDKNLDTNIRFSTNMKLYNQNMKNKTHREVIVLSVFMMEEIIDKILVIKIKESGNSSLEVPSMSFVSKIDLCYKFDMIRSALRRTLEIFSTLVDNFTNPNNISGFENLSTQTSIIELCEINNNDIFNLILKIINKDEGLDKKYSKLEDLIVDIGWSGIIKFIASIIQASLIEAYLELE